MNPTALAITIAYGAVCVVAIVVLAVIWASTHPRSGRPRTRDDADTARLAHGEKTWFVIAVAALGLLLLATLAFIPYGQNSAEAGQQRVAVTAQQFAWSFQPARIVAGAPVRFTVTSADVNHGFGVYNSDNVMLFQVQAMPDHPTDVVYTFKRPGRYQVVCLEFCGLNHHRMLGTFQVVPS